MSDLLEGLNEAQKQAVTHDQGPLLIVAGAGTGKTTVLTRRYAWLLQQKNLKTDQILALTFTEKAAQEMEDRVLQLLPNGSYDFWISTFHHACQRLLERYGLEIGLPHQLKILNETDAWLMLKRNIDQLPLDHYRPLGNPGKFLTALLSHFSRAKDEGVTPERYLALAQEATLDGDSEIIAGERKRLRELADCYHAYRRLSREQGVVDFGDLMVETLRLLRERPAILAELQKKFKVILIDEFQDTNWAQYEFLKLLAGTERSLTVVGDDDQAIYKFRGASLANILQFRDDFPEARTVALTENYRSHQQILDAAYRFIRKNDPNRLETTLAGLGLSKSLQSKTDGEGQVEAFWYRSLEEEASEVAEMIRSLKEQDPELSWNEIAILVRSNDSAIPFVHALERRKIPFRFFALRGLYAKSRTLDLLALFSVCDGSADPTFMWRVLCLDVFEIPIRDIAVLSQYASRKGISLWQVVRLTGVIKELSELGVKQIQHAASVMDRLSEAARREKPLHLLHLILEHTGLLAKIVSSPEMEKRETLSHLNTFANRIKRYEAMTHGPSLKGFLEELRMEIESGEEGALDFDPESGPEMVKIMTVHAAKGLEFRHVFIVSMVDQRFPTRERSEGIPLPDGLVQERLPTGDAHLEEERRLFYVALTRAKAHVVLTGASQYGGSRKKKPSVFFEEAQIAMTMVNTDEPAMDALTLKQKEEDANLSDEQIAFPLKRRFSFTQLAAFRNCPLQYKFAHVYRVPVLGSFHKSFGQSMHLTLHDILQTHLERGSQQQGSLFSPATLPYPTTGLRVTLAEALEAYVSRWIDEWYPNRRQHDAYFQEGRDAIKRLWELWNASPPAVHALELPFDWRIDEHSLKGSVDRIDTLPDGGVAIYDYKTGEGKDSEDLSSEDKEQLRIYQLAMEQRGLVVKKLAYLYVRTGQEAEVDLLQGDKREKFIQDLSTRMKEILHSTFPPQPSPFLCRYCDFRNICEYRKM